MKNELAEHAYRAVESYEQPVGYGTQGQLWQRRNGIWYVLYGKHLRKMVSARTKDFETAKAFMARFFA